MQADRPLRRPAPPGRQPAADRIGGRCGVEFDLASLPRSLERHGLRAG